MVRYLYVRKFCSFLALSSIKKTGVRFSSCSFPDPANTLLLNTEAIFATYCFPSVKMLSDSYVLHS